MRHFLGGAPKYAAGGGGGFAPTDIPGCQLWADPSDTSSWTADGSNLLTWSDKSGNGNDATIATTSNTIMGARTINGLNVLDCSATHSGRSIYFDGLTVGNDMTVFMVFDADSSTGQLFDLRNPSDGLPLLDDNSEAGRNARRRNDGWAAMVSLNPATHDTNPHVLAVTYDSTSDVLAAYRDGTLIDSGSIAGTTTGLSKFYFGQGAGSVFTGGVGEGAVYDSALDDTDRATVESYLSTKWGTP